MPSAYELDRDIQIAKALNEGRDPNKMCLRTDRESAPLPCMKIEGHDGPCYFRSP